MRVFIRRMAIRHLLPLSWKLGDERVARSLQRFALVESDSAWQFLRAVEVLERPEHKAAMFHDALEEMSHAEGFSRLAARYAPRALPLPREARSPLIERADQLGEFLAYIYVGERDVYAEFDDYSRAARRADIEAHLAAIQADEAGHHEDAERTMLSLFGSAERFARLQRQARWRRFRESANRVSTWSGRIVSGLLLGILYFVAGALLTVPARRRLGGRELSG